MSFESRDILDEHLTEKGSKLQNEIQKKMGENFRIVSWRKKIQKKQQQP